jgi:anti-sigma B factor antagonist
MFTLPAEVTIYQAARLHGELQAEDEGLELSGVNELDTAGVQLLLVARAAARARGHELRLVNPSAVVREVFATLGEKL